MLISDRINVALAEFSALRDEINMKLRMAYEIYTIYFTGLGIFYGYIIGKTEGYLIIGVPIFSLALFFRLHYDQLMIRTIGDYINTHISTILSINPGPFVMQWEQFNKNHHPAPYYKYSIFVTFVLLSAVPAIGYSTYTIIFYYLFASNSTLPICVHWVSILVNLTIGSFICYRIFKDTF